MSVVICIQIKQSYALALANEQLKISRRIFFTLDPRKRATFDFDTHCDD